MNIRQSNCLILKHFTKLSLVAVWGVVLLFAVGSFAQTSSQSVDTVDSVAKKVINSLPSGSTKEGLLRYFSILNPDSYDNDAGVGDANEGIVSYFENKLAQNKCFKDAADKFYGEINSAQVARDDRPSLADIAGGTKNPALSPGWIYKKALDFSQQNPNAALSLIGLCGHDDINRGRADFFCPEWTSDFYIPQGLDASADISPALKKSISSLEAPRKNPALLAAKYYHVMGAAFMTCQMIEAGMNPLMAIQVEASAGNLYRGIRLCEAIKEPARIYKSLSEFTEIRWSLSLKSFDQEILAKALERSQKRVCNFSKVKKDPLCALLNAAGATFDAYNADKLKDAKTKLEEYIPKMIASGLYSSWYFGGEILGTDLPCTQLQLAGPGPLLKWLGSQKGVPLNVCGEGLSSTACRSALKTMATWQSDYEWTIAQHTAGAKFAATVCKPYPKNQSSYEAFCK